MLAFACIAPHGGEIIAELCDGDLARMARTRAAMQRLGAQCAKESPDTLVVYTPHGCAVEGCITISHAHSAAGHLDGPGGVRVSIRMDVDLALAEALSHQASNLGVPTGLVAVKDDGAPIDEFPMDWGALIPLWFLCSDPADPPRVVIACPDRSLPRTTLVDFGRATVHAARRLGRRIAVVCSADQGHGHSEDGPYGYSSASAPHDQAFCRAVRDGALQRLMHWREDRLDAALTDSFWQTLMLHGALLESPLTGALLSYEAPTYFGMACASYTLPEKPL